jgi:hypothetical protein
MRKRSSPVPIILGLLLVGLMTVLIDFSGILKTQILQTPESLSSVKLVKQKSDPIRFDIYYDQLQSAEPDDISIIFVNSLIESGGRYSNSHQIIDQVLLQTGQAEVVTSVSNETVTIKNITPQGSTKLGTIVTRLKKDEYISLEYDTVVNRTRMTFQDNPVPRDFPIGYKTFLNPTSELLYVSSPGFHTILSYDEKVFVKTEKIHHGAVLIPNTITTLQELDSLNQSTLINEPINRVNPSLTIEQNQIVLPKIPHQDLNTLILRYRSGSNSWDYNYFLLTATKDLTLKVPLERMLDFYTEVEYAFASLSEGFGTVNSQFPYNSLLPDGEFPAYYRTDFTSFVPELAQLKNSLQMGLTVSIAPQSESIAIGVLTREPLLTLQDAVLKMEQKLPVMIFEDDSAEFTSSVTSANQLPYFNLVGKNNQIWSQRVNKPNLSLVSQQFQQIPLVASEQISELERVQTSKGDKLLCFLKTETASYSLAILDSDIILTTSCLESARRAGFTEGRIYPVQYQAKENKLIALRHYDFESSLSSQAPLLKNYNPNTKEVTLSNNFSRERVRLMVSSTPDFERYSTQAVEISQSSFSLPILAGCENSCYFKILSVIREDEDNMLAYASETLFFAESELPVIHLCFSNQAHLKNILNPEELNVQILHEGEAPTPLTYRSSSGCYEYAAEEVAESEDGITTSSLDGFFTQSEILPERTIVFHTNGLSNSHINVPSQRHYLVVKTDSLQQVLVAPIAFEHYQLSSDSAPLPTGSLQKSYLTNILGSQANLITINRGNILLQKENEIPFFTEKISVTPPLNETVLYPGSGHSLTIPNTIRFFNSDEVVLQGFQENNKSIVLSLPVPERSEVRMFLENVLRPNIQVQQLITDGIRYNPDNGFVSLENPNGMISLPIQISLEKPIDVSAYASTFPPTSPPADIDLATFNTQLVFEVVEPSTIPSTSILDPIILPRAQAGFEYEAEVPLGGILQTSSFEIGESEFLTQECQDSFQFNKEERKIIGLPAQTSTLQSCYFQLQVRYLQKLAYAQIEVTTLRTYRIALLEKPNSTELEPEVISVPVQKDTNAVSQVIRVLEPLEEVIETTSEFVPKSNEGELISSIGELSIVFNPQLQQFTISGNPSALNSVVSRFIQAIRSDTGEIVLMELRFIPAQQQEVVLPIVQSFPNQINLPVILEELNFSESEISTMTLATASLGTEVELSDENMMTIFGLPELNNQIFSVILEKDVTTPSALVEFDDRLSGSTDDGLPNTLRIDFRLSVSEPETVVLNTVELNGGKNVVIDLRAFLPANHTLNSTQIPSFLIPNGYVLSGRTPTESQELELLIQDFTDVKNYLIPLRILGIEQPATIPDEPVITDEPDLKPSADTEFCFPDISDQPLEYREAICLAKQYNIISGSGGKFFPNDPINRAEISKILVTGPLVIFGLLKTEELPALNSAYLFSRFPDVPRSAWYYGFVETVKEVEIFSGYPDGTFKPAESLNKAEASKVIVNTLLQLHPQSFPANVIQANTIRGDQWFAPYIRVLNQNGGDLEDANAFVELSKPITRAQFIYNLLILLDSKAEGIMGQLQ